MYDFEASSLVVVESGKPFGCNASLEWLKVDVNSKDKIRMLIDKKGNIGDRREVK